mgnify:CR=1 FL=1
MTYINFNASNTLVIDLNKIISKGYFKSKDEALNDALSLFIRKHKADVARKRIFTIRNKLRGVEADFTDEVVKSHEEEK